MQQTLIPQEILERQPPAEIIPTEIGNLTIAVPQRTEIALTRRTDAIDRRLVVRRGTFRRHLRFESVFQEHLP